MIGAKCKAPRVSVAPAARGVTCRANADRRAVLGSLLAGVATVSAGQAVAADNTAGPVDLFDDRKVRQSGFDVIYEARDLDLTQNQRDGLTQYRGDLSATKQRYQESIKRIQSKVPGYIDKAYWTEAREELRRQVGFFRFDLRNLATSRGTKAQRNEGLDKAKNLVKATERLDYTISKKNKEEAKREYETVVEKLKDFDKFVAA